MVNLRSTAVGLAPRRGHPVRRGAPRPERRQPCRSAAPRDAASPSGPSSASSQPVATDDEVKARCTACHKLPPPDILPRSAWRDEMVRMMLIQEGVPEPAGATSFLPLSPDWLRLWRYYDAQGAGEAAGARGLAGRQPRAGAVREARGAGGRGVRRHRHLERAAVRRRRRQAPRHPRQRDADRPRAARPRQGRPRAEADRPAEPPRPHRAGRSRQGRARRLPRRRPRLVPAGRPQRRRGLLAAGARRRLVRHGARSRRSCLAPRTPAPPTSTATATST